MLWLLTVAVRVEQYYVATAERTSGTQCNLKFHAHAAAAGRRGGTMINVKGVHALGFLQVIYHHTCDHHIACLTL